MTNDEALLGYARSADFVIRLCFVICHLDFVIRAPVQANGRRADPAYVSRCSIVDVALVARVMLGRFRTAHDQLAPEEFLVVQFLDGAFRLIDRLHLDEGEPFRALVVPVGHDLRVLDVADAVEQLEEIALGGVE